ncbi:polyketide cyclase [Aeromicrobium sp. A1-2]|uniref:SRPBCC family protein n=1 Tax=Aeromicrobium sp. A1-2 TaxID=2107713 RepID=UPI000E549CB7|nr:SRPBCC family protein [Aeromicrobium sp. A1-2]AXT83764.1 polyketide cyclase [Aeromicrobium sp. A1-2]AXT86671.1 polyketide cyclase [Aeromicrobium sp. A1-2]
MTDLSFEHSESIHVDRKPEAVYDLVSDIARTGEWSPICTGCEWDDGDGPAVGAHFTGTNEVPGRTWKTRSTVVAAEPGREFAWEVGDGFVRWGYEIEPDGSGAKLTESWKFCEPGLKFFADTFGETADAEIETRTRAAHTGIPVTLAAIKQVAESA